MHPDDYIHFMKCETAAAEFMFKNIPVEDFPHYKVSHCFRRITKDGGYKMTLHQGITFSTDENGLMNQTMLVHTDISHITDENNMLFSLIGLNGRPSYTGLDAYRDQSNILPTRSLFTAREKDILRHLANGLSAKEIGLQLNISYNTVRTHKQNLLRKADVKNSNELLAKAIQMRVV